MINFSFSWTFGEGLTLVSYIQSGICNISQCSIYTDIFVILLKKILLYIWKKIWIFCVEHTAVSSMKKVSLKTASWSVVKSGVIKLFLNWKVTK